MTEDEAQSIIRTLQYHFRNTLDDDQIEYWIDDILLPQPFGVSKKVVSFFTQDSGNNGWMFSPAEFLARLKEEQGRLSQAEARKINSASCSECMGLTWKTDDPSGLIPCPQCRVSSYSRWKEGAYRFGVPPNQDELDGPKQQYFVAAEPKHYSNGKPVEPARAIQWADHLKNRKATSVYPEGDGDWVDEEALKPEKEKEYVEQEF